MTAGQATTVPSRRDRQRQETRRDLAAVALELASTRGLANVRVPDIASAAGVSTRTFNNYFPSKEAAIAWPAMRRAARMADNLLARPADEALSEALAAAVSELHPPARDPADVTDWLGKLRSLVAQEPGLRGEYLKSFDVAEHELAGAIAVRTDMSADALWPRVLAAMVVGAERAAIRHWIRRGDPNLRLDETVRAALAQALAGVDA